MNLNRVYTIVRKDLMDVFSDGSTVATLFILPAIFSILLPLIILVGGTRNSFLQTIGGVNEFLSNVGTNLIPQYINRNLIGEYALLMFFFIPLFLLIPIMIATLTATTSFVGERENKTFEGLLYTPLTDSEIVFGKIMASMIPSVGISWLATLVYGIILDTVGYHTFSRIIFPNLSWVIETFVLVPTITFLSIALIIGVSQRAKSTKSAQSISMLLVLPLIGSVVSQASGLMVISLKLILVLTFVLVVIDVLIFIFVVKRFDREKITLGL